MKYLLACVCLITLASCSDSGESPFKKAAGNGTAYASCEQVPSSPSATQSSLCPGSSGTWNNYEVTRDPNGDVTQVQLWCGGTDEDHPENQSEYDQMASAFSGTSNQDYKSGADCVSGSYDETSGNSKTNIWQRVQ